MTGYGGAALAIVLATVLRLWLDPFLEDAGFVIFFGAVVVVSWLGGLGPSLLALMLSLMASAWFFAKPPGSTPDPPARVLLGLGFYLFVGVLTAVLSESMRGAKRRAESLADEALRQREALRDADRRKDEFLAILAHELRNPLSPICAALDILRLPDVDQATTQWAKEVLERQVRQLVRLVDDLLDMSRITSGKIELRNERSDLRAVFTRAIETAKPLIDEKGHDFVVTLPASPVILFVDPVRLAQVIGNLLTNAAKYTEPGGRIWLSAETAENEIAIRVRDTGIGIAPEMLSRVFDLFAQDPRSANGSQGGLGIGLGVVKALVELNGGKVEAHSDGRGTGTEVVVHLPARNVEESAPATVLNQADRIEDPPRVCRILVVDDNVDSAGALATLLRLEGHAVEESHDGPSALSAARAHLPDVAILDIGMPGMDGLETARRLRRLPGAESMLLVALTGWGQEADRDRTAEAGFDHHLVKPVAVESLRKLFLGLNDRSALAAGAPPRPS
ncbi:MAG TPA: ATP-binding protein [Pirellulales bacterium]|nr:ATP-binding protein [Pirellulales bacterium]